MTKEKYVEHFRKNAANSNEAVLNIVEADENGSASPELWPQVREVYLKFVKDNDELHAVFTSDNTHSK